MSELILIGGLDARHHEGVRDFCLRASVPDYSEPLSGLREDPRLDDLLIRNERMRGRGGFDHVIRVGNVPRLRFWRVLDASKTRVTHYSDLPFPGLTRGGVHAIEELSVCGPAKAGPHTDFLANDRELYQKLQKILDRETQSELAMLRALSQQIPGG